MRTRTSILIALILLFIGSGCSEQNHIQPNIILIMADDLGWGDTGFNGNEVIKTPNLDNLAQQGVIFSRFYSAAPVCSPTRASAITGRHPYRTGIYGANSGHLRPSEITLAELLRQSGYRTGHFGKWHLGTLTNTTPDANRGGKGDTTIYSPPWDNGFDVCFSTESKVPTWNPMITPGPDAGDIGKREPGSHFGTYYWSGEDMIVNDNLEGDDSRVIMDRVVPFIDECANSSTPFFAVIWFHTPHLPTLTGEAYRKLYSDYSEDIQHFYGAISAMDEQVGRLAKKLKEIKQFNNTLLFFTSDNGPEGKIREGRTQGSTNGLRGRKRSLYEGGIRVPSFALWPSVINGGANINIPLSTSDYLPTVSSIMGISQTNIVLPLDGEDIMPFINEQKRERTKSIGFRSGNQWVLTGSTYKLYSRDRGDKYELYNLISDPNEKNDIINNHPEVAKKMIRELEQWIESCNKSDRGSDYKQ